MKMHLTLLTSAAFVFAGCSVFQKNWNISGESQAEKKVKVSYEIPSDQTEPLNLKAGADLATQRCAEWGFGAASFTGNETKNCTKTYTGAYGNQLCMHLITTREYQCLGKTNLSVEKLSP